MSDLFTEQETMEHLSELINAWLLGEHPIATREKLSQKIGPLKAQRATTLFNQLQSNTRDNLVNFAKRVADASIQAYELRLENRLSTVSDEQSESSAANVVPFRR